MKALNNIQLPRTASLSSPSGQSERMNQQRLNENFQMISEAFYENEARMAALPKEILAQMLVPKAYVASAGSDGVWTWRKWNDGTIDAWEKTFAAQKTCDTADGSLFYGEMAVSLPDGLFSEILSVGATPISAAGVLATITGLSASEMTVRLYTTSATNATVELGLYLYGK